MNSSHAIHEKQAKAFSESFNSLSARDLKQMIAGPAAGVCHEKPLRMSLPRRQAFFRSRGPMPTLERQSLTGIGPVRIGPSWAYAYWQYTYDEDDEGVHSNQRWTIRLSIDDFERLNLP